MVETVAHSYRLCAPGLDCQVNLARLMALLDDVLGKILVISAPVVASLLISEALLGLLSRYAPQMNAFSVSLTIKSLVALGVLMLYFGTYVPDEILRMSQSLDRVTTHLGDPGGH